jgi:hypothetical protein
MNCLHFCEKTKRFISKSFDIKYTCRCRGRVVVKALCYKPEGRGIENG